MNLHEAIETMKRGGTVEHGGKMYKLMHHGIHDVTDEAEPVRVRMTSESWAALAPDAPEPVAPEAVDEALEEIVPGDDAHEEQPQ